MNTLFSQMITNQYIIDTRSYLRKNIIGKKIFDLVNFIFNKGYESKFQAELMRQIKAGDIVWDIGANVGFYTKKILDLVGNEGKVIAIEPAPLSAQKCREINHGGNLIVIESALGNQTGTISFAINNDDPTSPTNKLSDSENGVSIKITTGDNLFQQLGYVPNVIKIDVEGSEIEVLKGMQQILAHSNLRAIFIEVHSRILEENGCHDAVKIINKILKNNDFTIRWTDFSHIEAIKQ